MSARKLIDIYTECIKELFETSEHISGEPVDYDKLFREAPCNKDGQKIINYMEYYLDSKVFDEIVCKHLKRLKQWEKNVLNFNLYLGCSPTSCKKRWDELKEDLSNSN